MRHPNADQPHLPLSSDQAADFRYERRLDNALVNIGPEEDNFFYLKPFYGIEATSESAVYILMEIIFQIWRMDRSFKAIDLKNLCNLIPSVVVRSFHVAFRFILW